MSSLATYCTVTGCTGIYSVTTEASYSSLTANATIECKATSLSLSSAIEIDLGYAGDHSIVFDGYVKKITRQRPDGLFTIVANDILVRAVDFFLASDDPENPLTFHSISDYDLVNALLGEAGLPDVITAPPSPSFTFGTNEDGAKFNLQSVGEALQFTSTITGRVIFCSQGGNIHYEERWPYIVGGDTPDWTWVTGASGQILNISYEESNASIRDRIVVYGKDDIHAEAEDPSPYTVVRQTSVIAHEMIDTADLASRTAALNLTLLNRLGRSINIDLEGDHNVRARHIAHVTESYTGLDLDVFVYRVSHKLDDTGFQTSVVCVT